jgi:hypothetical protein
VKKFTKQILYQTLEKEDYEGQDMWKECQKKELRQKLFKNIPEVKRSESQERDGWTMLKLI